MSLLLDSSLHRFLIALLCVLCKSFARSAVKSCCFAQYQEDCLPSRTFLKSSTNKPKLKLTFYAPFWLPGHQNKEYGHSNRQFVASRLPRLNSTPARIQIGAGCPPWHLG